MTINNDMKAQILADHYKDTFQYVSQLIVARNRLLLLVLILLALQFFQISSPEEPSKTIIGFFKPYLDLQVTASKDSLTAVLWFALLSIVIRYFQTNIYINKQYEYLHKLEEKLTVIFDDQIISREGGHYLKNYLKFSTWCHILYTWAFPILLIITTGFNLTKDFPGCNNAGIAYLFSIIFYLIILFSTTLYMYSMHFEAKEKKQA